MQRNPTDTKDALQRLKDEIQQLSDEHSEALKAATYRGMTAEEAEVCHARRARITELINQMMQLYPSA
jgi:hypothetical protein